MSKVWLVTGSASGLGRDIAAAVLASGDRLVATARNPKQLADLVAQYGDKVRAVALDVTTRPRRSPPCKPRSIRLAVSMYSSTTPASRTSVLSSNSMRTISAGRSKPTCSAS